MCETFLHLQRRQQSSFEDIQSSGAVKRAHRCLPNDEKRAPKKKKRKKNPGHQTPEQKDEE